MKKWKTLSSELVFNNKWFKVQKDIVSLPNGKVIDDFFIWNSKDAAIIFALTSNRKIVLVKQYKHGSDSVMIECPAGYVENKETPEISIKREFMEETGYVVDSIAPLLSVVHHPTKETSKLHIFFSDSIKKSAVQNFDETEEIEVMEVPINKALDMIKDGQIWASGTICAIFLGLNKLGYRYEL